MKVLVAGATGAIGRPLVSALMAAGHEVMGMSSSENGARSLREKGAEGEVANALDENAVLALVRRVKPDAVIDELTSLPKRYTPEEMRAAADRDRNVRLVGGHNVHNAARAAGARRYIAQSTGFFYGPGEGLATEKDALAVNASPGVAGSARTYMQIEERVLGVRDLLGVALRYGFFYGRERITTRFTGACPSRSANRRIQCLARAAAYSRLYTLKTRRLRPWRRLKAILAFTTLWMTILQR